MLDTLLTALGALLAPQHLLFMAVGVVIGMAIGITDRTGLTESVQDILIGPGFAVIIPIDDLFVGVDARGEIVTGDGVSGFLLAGTFGMRFE